MSSTLAGAPKSYEHVLTCLVRDLHSHSDDDNDTLGRISGISFDLGDKNSLWQQYGGVWDPPLSRFVSFLSESRGGSRHISW